MLILYPVTWLKVVLDLGNFGGVFYSSLYRFMLSTNRDISVLWLSIKSLPIYLNDSPFFSCRTMYMTCLPLCHSQLVVEILFVLFLHNMVHKDFRDLLFQWCLHIKSLSEFFNMGISRNPDERQRDYGEPWNISPLSTLPLTGVKI